MGHIQKRMGTALRELKRKNKGMKLNDGKTIGGKGRLTNVIIDKIQNYMDRPLGIMTIWLICRMQYGPFITI